jgi:hypothetical protein
MKQRWKLDKIGTDAEVFLVNGHNHPVPACGLVGGTKEEPKPVPALGEGFAVQEDNVMLEFNLPASSAAKEFISNLDKMLAHIRGEMGNKGLLPVIQSSMRFKQEQLQSDQARTFGCEPDYCVWTRTPNAIDKTDPKLQELRTAAAHVHISYTYEDGNPDLFDMEQLVKALDLFLGAPSVLRYPGSSQRRAFYGKAGAFRPKPYGVEYRTLGNEWIATPGDVQWVFDQIDLAFRFLNVYTKYELESIFSKLAPSITRGINECNMWRLSYLEKEADAHRGWVPQMEQEIAENLVEAEAKSA